MRNLFICFCCLKISHPKLCCGYSKESSQQDCSFEHPKHMFKLMGKKIIVILRSKVLLNWTYVEEYDSGR